MAHVVSFLRPRRKRARIPMIASETAASVLRHGRQEEREAGHVPEGEVEAEVESKAGGEAEGSRAIEESRREEKAMTERRFRVDGPLVLGAWSPLSADTQHHLRVLRLSAGEAITLFDGRGTTATATLERDGARVASLLRFSSAYFAVRIP